MRNRNRTSLRAKEITALIIWTLLAFFVMMQIGHAQYTGAKPYTQYFGWGQQDFNHNLELTLTNSSAYDMTVVVVDHWSDQPVDHVYLSAYGSHTFYNFPPGDYCYRLEVNNDYKKMSDYDTYPECPATKYSACGNTITFTYTTTGGNGSQPISKQDFFY